MTEAAKKLRDEFLAWVQTKPIPGAKFYEKAPDRFRFESSFAMGELNFHDLEVYVTELRITDFKTDETAFFLHFELNDLAYAKELFNEFLDGYEDLRTRRDIRILLSCTSALTTSYMAKKLNETADLLKQDFHFDATALTALGEKIYDYDMVLLAPQTAQKLGELRTEYPAIPIRNIPAGLFATYDAPAVLETVRTEWKEHLAAAASASSMKTLDNLHNDATILSIALLPQGRGRFSIQYRYYQNGAILFDETVIKQHLDLTNDLCDILDTAVYRYGKYDIIGISIGAIIRDGCVDMPGFTDKDFNLKKYLEEKYHVPVLINNNTNTAAYGYFARNPEYRSVAFLSIPFGYRFGGVGLVLNGTPYAGSHNIAGEVKYTLLHEYEELDNHNYSLLPGETLKTVEMYARSIISLVDPDILLVRCKLLPDTDILQMRLISYIPEEYLPAMKKISDEDSTEYMLLGMMLECTEKVEKE